jgi:Sodium/hydrogen exchanger family
VLNHHRRYFLPPIIFYAGLSVKKKKFFRNFASIATLGILGTYILFAVIALGLFAISKLPNLLNLTVRGLFCGFCHWLSGVNVLNCWPRAIDHHGRVPG